MERITIQPRPDAKSKLEEIGFSFHSWDGYWNESACYKFGSTEIDHIESVTSELHDMCLSAARHVIYKNRFKELGIPEQFWEPIKRSWENDDFSIYGRFDLAYDGVNPPKMLEYNADTPTSLLESSVAQWYWLQDVKPDADQFNSLHEKLVSRWEQFKDVWHKDEVHFASLKDNEEDWVCVHYMMDTAKQAGLSVKHLYVEELGVPTYPAANQFVDLENRPIDALFKLYPWEWLMREDFSKHILTSSTTFVEPLWKSVLSCKGILPILWELYPGHPNLLESYFSPEPFKAYGSYVKKPLYSREGANVEIFENNKLIESDEGPYGAEGAIYQALFHLPSFTADDEYGKRYPVIGSWIVGDEPAGMCIREDTKRVTTNMSNFVPHYFE